MKCRPAAGGVLLQGVISVARQRWMAYSKAACVWADARHRQHAEAMMCPTDSNVHMSVS